MSEWGKQLDAWVGRTMRLIDEHESFCVQVMALTGWPEARAATLDSRLAKLAKHSVSHGHQHYRDEWRRRYTRGWKYSGPRGTGLFSAGPVTVDELVAAMARRDS